MTVTVAYEQMSSYPASIDRMFLAQHRMPGLSAMEIRDGIFLAPGVTPLSCVAVSGAMTVNVKPGSASVAGYFVIADAEQPVAIEPTSTTARTDIIVLRVYDSEAGDGQDAGAIEVVQGTSSTAPVTPARSLLLAQVTLPAQTGALTGAMVTDKRVWTVSRGGILPSSGRLASPPNLASDSLATGQAVWDAAANALGIVASGTAWAKLSPPKFDPTYIQMTSTGTVAVAGSNWTEFKTSWARTAGTSTAGPIRGDTGGILIDTPGIYIFEASVSWASGGGLRRLMGPGPAGTASALRRSDMAGANVSLIQQMVSMWEITAPMRVTLYGYHDNAGTINTTGRTMSAYRIL